MDALVIRRDLISKLANTLHRRERIDAHLRNSDRDRPDDAPDRATVVGNDEVLERLEERNRVEAAEIREAIRRIDAGTFGRCTECGEPIERKRLLMMPENPLCRDCAALA